MENNKIVLFLKKTGRCTPWFFLLVALILIVILSYGAKWGLTNKILSENVAFLGTVSAQKEVNQSYNFLIIGDSFMAENGAVAEPLEEKLLSYKNISVTHFGKVNSGLVDTSFFDWNKKASELITKSHPDFVVILIGNNDVKSFKAWNQDGKRIFLEFGTSQWKEAYRKKIKNFLQIFSDRGINVYWIGLPMMQDQNFSNQIKELNEIYKEEMVNFPNVQFISIWDLLSDGNGNYATYLKGNDGKYYETRREDGIHLTHFSGGIISQKVVDEISKKIKLE